MNNRWLAGVGIASLASLVSEIALADTGPVLAPLRVTQMYTKDTNSVIYVSFQTGAMPGCYGNSGGYLYLNNPLFKELYAQVLTMTATGGIAAAVVYTRNAPTGNWGDCTIDGLYLQPQ